MKKKNNWKERMEFAIKNVQLKDNSILIVELSNPEEMRDAAIGFRQVIDKSMKLNGFAMLLAPLGKFNASLFDIEQMNSYGWFRKEQILGVVISKNKGVGRWLSFFGNGLKNMKKKLIRKQG